jgi:hypothetical protein
MVVKRMKPKRVISDVQRNGQSMTFLFYETPGGEFEAKVGRRVVILGLDVVRNS